MTKARKQVRDIKMHYPARSLIKSVGEKIHIEIFSLSGRTKSNEFIAFNLYGLSFKGEGAGSKGQRTEDEKLGSWGSEDRRRSTEDRRQTTNNKQRTTDQKKLTTNQKS